MENRISAIGKIKTTLDWLILNLDASKLESGEDIYTHYFISYFDECSRAICEKDGIEYDDASRFLVYVEAAKRCGNWKLENQEELEKAKILLANIRSTEFGKRGVEDGMKDGEYVTEPSNPGPYYNLARVHFGLPPAEPNDNKKGGIELGPVAKIWHSTLLGGSTLMIVGFYPYKWMSQRFDWRYLSGLVVFGFIALYAYDKLFGID